MAKYTLPTDGDPYEQRFYQYLGHRFSKYEEFWQTFVTPLTNRQESGDQRLRSGIDPLLEEMCMAHYGVYWYLGLACDPSAPLTDDGFHTVFYHLSTSTELVERLIFTLARIEDKVIGRFKLFEPLTISEIRKRFEDYCGLDLTTEQPSINSAYTKAYSNFKDRNRSVSIALHGPSDTTKAFMGQLGTEASAAYTEWGKAVQPIRHYRNALIHNPRIAVLTDGKTFSLPKEEKLHKYRLWSATFYGRDDADFIDLTDCISGLIDTYIDRTNNLWEYLINFHNSQSSESAYRKMTYEIEDNNISGRLAFPDRSAPSTGQYSNVPGGPGSAIVNPQANTQMKPVVNSGSSSVWNSSDNTDA